MANIRENFALEKKRRIAFEYDLNQQKQDLKLFNQVVDRIDNSTTKERDITTVTTFECNQSQP